MEPRSHPVRPCQRHLRVAVAVAVAAVTLFGDRLSIERGAGRHRSACVFVPVHPLTSAVIAARLRPAGAAMLACVFGRHANRYGVALVVAVMLVDSVTVGVSLDGLVTEPRTAAPTEPSVISTRLTPTANTCPERDRNRGNGVRAAPRLERERVGHGRRCARGQRGIEGSVPVASVVTFGVTGEPVGTDTRRRVVCRSNPFAKILQ